MLGFELPGMPFLAALKPTIGAEAIESALVVWGLGSTTIDLESPIYGLLCDSIWV